MLSVLILLFTLGGPVDVRPIGDGGSHRLVLQNTQIHVLPLRFEGQGTAPGRDVPGYGQAALEVQCARGGSERAPPVVLQLEREVVTAEIPSPSFVEGLPAVLITSEARTLSAELMAMVGLTSLRRVMPAELPTSFAGLRYARLLAVGGADRSRLSERQWRVLRDAVAAGATLVVDMGNLEAGAGASPAWLPAVATSPAPLGPAGLLALPRSIRIQGLLPQGPDARATVEADGQPLVVERALGFGTVRMTAFELDALDATASALVFATLGAGPDRAAAVEAAMDADTPLPRKPILPFGPRVFGVLALVAVAGLIARSRAVWGGLVLGVTLLLAAVVPGARSTPEPHRILDLSLAFKDGEGDAAVHLMNIDHHFARGGPHAFELGHSAMALEESEPLGSCVVWDAEPFRQLRLTTVSEPASTSRVRLLYIGSRFAPSGEAGALRLPLVVDSGLSGATLLPVIFDGELAAPDARAFEVIAGGAASPTALVLPAPLASPP